MCGRMFFSYTGQELAQRYQREGFDGISVARFNFAPGQKTWCLGSDGFFEAVWGFAPSWAQGLKPVINARVETVRSKPYFREAFRARRCIVPVRGYYEWRPSDAGGKQPYLIRAATRASAATDWLSLAGLWEPAAEPGGWPGFVILTQPALDAYHPELPEIHARMPLILPPDQEAVWLDHQNPDAFRQLDLRWVQALAHPSLELHPVSGRVNQTRNDDPDLLAPARPYPVQMGLF